MGCHLGIACSLKYWVGGRNLFVTWLDCVLNSYCAVFLMVGPKILVFDLSTAKLAFCLWWLITGLLILILWLTASLSLQSKFELALFEPQISIISRFWFGKFGFQALVLWNLYKRFILMLQSNIRSILVHYLSFLLFPGKAPPGATEHVISGVRWRGRVTCLEEHCGFEFSGDNGPVCVSIDFNGACCSDTS